MRTIALICAIFVVAAVAKTKWSELHEYSFVDYLSEFEKSYEHPEFKFRKAIFEERLKSIKAHNQDSTKTWKRGVNQFSDWTAEELKQLRGYKKELTHTSTTRQAKVRNFANIDLAGLPASVDWRTQGVVTPVKDQGRCGSCWSFGSAETVESHWALATNQLMSLSEQQILDCTANPNQCGGTGGCNGGTAELAFEQIIQIGGLQTEWTYPYISYFGEAGSCHANTSNFAYAKLKDYVVLPSNVYEPLMAAVANLGPISISVEASHWSDYESGVFDGCNQTNPDIDHAVQLVGYGSDADLGDYWLVRNSWSAAWGELGYIRVRRTSDEQNRCGLDITPSDGTGCKNGPPSVTVCGTCGILYDNAYPIVAH